MYVYLIQFAIHLKLRTLQINHIPIKIILKWYTRKYAVSNNKAIKNNEEQKDMRCIESKPKMSEITSITNNNLKFEGLSNPI